MLMRCKLGAVFILLLSQAALAKKEVVFFGGGGEPQGSTTIFDDTYEDFAPFAKNSGWVARSYFDGGHSESEALAHKKFPNANKSMTVANIEGEIATLKNRIQKGDLKSGDQIMVTIATHGLPRRIPRLAHGVATIDGQFDVSKLAELRNLAEKKGVKLAIIDFSCHSGTTLDLATDKTCVISSSSEGVAYNTSGQAFAKSFKRFSNLEEAFLEGRRSVSVAAPPLISTEAGVKTFQATKVLAESMAERSEVNFREKAESLTCRGPESAPYKKLLGQLADIKKSMSTADYLKMKVGLKDYDLDKIQDRLGQAMKKYEDMRTDAKRTFLALQELNKDKCYKLSRGKDICGNHKAFEYSYSKLFAKKFITVLSESEREELAFYQKHLDSPEFKMWKKLSKGAKKQSDLVREAKEVAAVEREVYQALYEQYSKSKQKPNPCRSFDL